MSLRPRKKTTLPIDAEARPCTRITGMAPEQRIVDRFLVPVGAT
ncbi:MAG: hypothetical protein AB7T06_33440 [Kofleriaceae bacterium]